MSTTRTRRRTGNASAGDPTVALGMRFDDAMGYTRDPAEFKPTEFGESLAWHIVKLICMTAPEGDVRAYEACEINALDAVFQDLRASVVREVAKATAA